MKAFPKWPLVRKSTHLKLWRENAELRSALKRANEELRKHRELIAGIKSGKYDVPGMV